MKITIHKSIDPVWPRYAVIESGRETQWFRTKAKAEAYAQQRSKESGKVFTP